MDKKTIIRNIVIAICVVVCAVAYFRVKSEETRPHSQEAYEQYQAEHLEYMEEQEEQARIDELYDRAVPYEDIIESPYDYVGCDIKVCGDIADISILNDTNGRPTFIDMGEAYPSTERFTIVIWEENYEDVSFVLEDITYTSTIFVEGVVEMYDGIPQIEVTNSGQIQVL